MFKFVLSSLLISIFLLISINSCSLDNSSSEESDKNSDISIKTTKKIEVIDSSSDTNKEIVIEDTTHTEIASLFEKANSLTHSKGYKKALIIYAEIIMRLKNKNDIKLLKDLSKAYFFRASIFKNYLQDKDKAIEAYNSVIDRFENSKDENLLMIYYKAQVLKAYLLDKSEAIETYNEIINKFKNSNSIKLLKKFASAQFAKSYLLEAEDRIEVYDEIIEKFKDTTNKIFLDNLSKAQFRKANLLRDCFHNKQDAIDVYDEIIEKLKPYENDGFSQNVTDALFFKSYLLMEEDYKQESMELFDEVIDRCQSCENGEIPQNYEFSLINNIEIALITNCDDSRYRDLAQKHLSDAEDTKPQLEMLSILRNAQDLNQDEAMQSWREQYKDFQFNNWSFEELKKWNNRMENSEQRERIKGYLDEFIIHSGSFIGEYLIIK